MRIAFYIAFGIWVVSEWRVSLRSAFNRRGSRLDRGSMQAVVLTAAAGLGAAFVFASHDTAKIETGRWFFFVAGLILMLAGTALRQWAVFVLGRFFTTDVRVQSDQTVIEDGPYRWVRHPSYTGLIVTFIGTGLALGNWASVAVLAVVPTIGLVIRIRAEERALLAELGEPYRHFAESRARLFPNLW